MTSTDITTSLAIGSFVIFVYIRLSGRVVNVMLMTGDFVTVLCAGMTVKPGGLGA